jgi:hypothetical protein
MIRFDPPRQQLYWCGHPIRPPAYFTFQGGVLRANGVGPQRVPDPDSAAREARLAAHFRDVPFVRRMHASGYSYLDAVNAYGRAKLKASSDAARAFGVGTNLDPETGLLMARAAVDPEVVDTTADVAIDSSGITLTFRGEGTERVPIHITALAAEASASPVPDTSGCATASVSGIAACFQRYPRALIIGNPRGILYFTGARAEVANAQLASVLDVLERSGSLPEEHVMIPRPMLLEIYYAAHPR